MTFLARIKEQSRNDLSLRSTQASATHSCITEGNMFARATIRTWKLLAFAALFSMAAACSDSETTGPAEEQLVGTWDVTSFQAFGVDAIQQGMSMELTLTAGKTYTIVITDDFLGTCDPETSCTESGSYSSTSTQITMDPGTEDEVTFNYSISGSTMTFTGNIEGIPVTMILRRS